MQMKQAEHAQKMQHQADAAKIKAVSDLQMANIFASTERAKGQQQLMQQQQAHQQSLQQSKETQKLQTQKSQSGSSTRSQKPTSKK